MLINEKHLAELNSPIQRINARVELHSGSTLVQICTCQDYLSNFSVERVGEGKFFGYGISHKLNVQFIDPNKELNLTDIDFIEITFGVDGDFIYPFPIFYISEVTRDEATNDINVVAFDALYQAVNHNVSELTITPPYTLKSFAIACASLIGMPFKIIGVDDNSFNTSFPQGANFDGTESIRSVLNAIAEATQTIYYMSGNWELTFKRLDRTENPVLIIDKNQYIDLRSGANCILGAICHTTELGDSITATATEDGVTQYIRNNPFLELREDAGTLLDNAIAAVGGSTINPFDCNWIGNYLLEIGDEIALVREDGSKIITYIVDDSITFDGTLGQTSRWEFISDAAETADNPTSLGESLNQTFARVDKINKQIDLIASETNTNTENISALQINTNSISASVKSIEETTKNSIDTINNNYETLSNEVALKMNSSDVEIAISTEMAKGVDKVKTSTGFTFNGEGLTVSKSDSGISTTITEDGMKISRSGEEVLIADNQGVRAEDLHATTYLIIGNNMRFEEQGGRAACFWIGD